MSRQPLPLLLLCWLAYFTVPLVNNISVFGDARVILCATKGVMIHAIAPKTSSHVNHHQHHNHHAHVSSDGIDFQSQSVETHNQTDRCPCIHFFFDTTFHLKSINILAKAQSPCVDDSHDSPIANVSDALARGPPTTPPTLHFFIT